ncbi:MAG TPA: hypothetical protein VMX18_03895 [Candidatus Bipolaricaulota bacterium]|nr:hypothetical protein [Candidatus Bipolaricaulota bacterium]
MSDERFSADELEEYRVWGKRMARRARQADALYAQVGAEVSAKVEAAERAPTLEAVHFLVSHFKLTPKEWMYLYWRYAMRLHHKDVAVKMEVSRPRVSQLGRAVREKMGLEGLRLLGRNS